MAGSSLSISPCNVWLKKYSGRSAWATLHKVMSSGSPGSCTPGRLEAAGIPKCTSQPTAALWVSAAILGPTGARRHFFGFARPAGTGAFAKKAVKFDSSC